MEKKFIESDMAVQVLQDAVKRYPDSYYNGLVVAKNLIFNLPAADVVSRDEGIKMGAELAAMHGSDATSQELEKAYLEGVAEGMKRRNVRPVVRGKWMHKEITVDFHSVGQCSFCKERRRIDNFCPNCGADMRPTSMSGANGEEI